MQIGATNGGGRHFQDATERLTGLSRRVTIDNAMERFRTKQRTNAVDRLEAIFGTAEDAPEMPRALALGAPQPAVVEIEDGLTPGERQAIQAAHDLIVKAERVLPTANAEDAAELKALLADLRAAIGNRAEDDITTIAAEVEDLVFYLEDQ